VTDVAIGFDCRDVAARASDHLEGALPLRERAGVWWHLAGCAHCRRLLRQMRAVSGALGLLGADVLPAARPQPARAPRLALAAGALTALVLVALMLVPAPGLQRELYAHALDPHAQPGEAVPAAAVAQALAEVGARLETPLPGVVYANRCPFEDGFVAHLLLVRDRRIVTVMVLPFVAREGAFARGRLHGVVMRAGPASVAVLAPEAAAARALGAHLAAGLRWDSAGG
jgi:hypothetical protein